MKPSTKKMIYMIEIVTGIVAMFLGGLISFLVWNNGYFMGALMLVVTGALSCVLGWKEWKGWTVSRTQETFLVVLRRTFFFMNLMLSFLVVGTLISMQL